MDSKSDSFARNAVALATGAHGGVGRALRFFMPDGVEAPVRNAAATYAGLGVRVNAVAPGLTDTPMTANM